MKIKLDGEAVSTITQTIVDRVALPNSLSYTIPQAASACGVTEDSIRGAIDRMELRCTRRGKKLLIPRKQLEAWVNGG